MNEFSRRVKSWGIHEWSMIVMNGEWHRVQVTRPENMIKIYNSNPPFKEELILEIKSEKYFSLYTTVLLSAPPGSSIKKTHLNEYLLTIFWEANANILPASILSALFVLLIFICICTWTFHRKLSSRCSEHVRIIHFCMWFHYESTRRIRNELCISEDNHSPYRQVNILWFAFSTDFILLEEFCSWQ